MPSHTPWCGESRTPRVRTLPSTNSSPLMSPLRTSPPGQRDCQWRRFVLYSAFWGSQLPTCTETLELYPGLTGRGIWPPATPPQRSVDALALLHSHGLVTAKTSGGNTVWSVTSSQMLVRRRRPPWRYSHRRRAHPPLPHGAPGLVGMAGRAGQAEADGIHQSQRSPPASLGTTRLRGITPPTGKDRKWLAISRPAGEISSMRVPHLTSAEGWWRESTELGSPGSPCAGRH